MIKYHTSIGTRVSESTIQRKLSEAYKKHYIDQPLGFCEGCGKQAVCTAHIVPKARCKHLHKSDMIWNPYNWFRSCYECNQIAENPQSDSIKNLINFPGILEVTKAIDPERYHKLL